MKVLVFLAEHAGTAVAKTDLLDHVWEGRAVSEEVLSVAVSQLRRALGCTPRDPRYIETLPKFGYRLIAAVESDTARRRTFSRAALAVSAVLLAFTLLRIVGDRPQHAAEPSPTPISRTVVSPDAYRAWLHGRYLMQAGRAREAIDRFELALATEPGFADAHVDLGLGLVALADRDVLDPATAYPRARAAAERALELEPRHAGAHLLLGRVLYAFAWDLDAAEAALHRAVRLAPSDARGHAAYADLLVATGRFDEAIEQIRLWQELEPLAYSRPRAARVLNVARRHEAALVELLTQLEVEPDDPELRLALARTYLHLERVPEAWIQAEEALRLCGTGRAELEALEAAFRRDGPAGLFRMHLTWLEEERSAGARVSAVSLAQASVAAGNRDEPFDWLERALEDRDPELLWIRSDPAFDPLRADPRFSTLLARIGLAS